MKSNDLKVVVREEEDRTNVYRNKRVVEINHARNIISFWETNYTFREIIELVLSVPEIQEQLLATIESLNEENHI